MRETPIGALVSLASVTAVALDLKDRLRPSAVGVRRLGTSRSASMRRMNGTPIPTNASRSRKVS